VSKIWQAHAQHIVDAMDKIERILNRGDIETDDILYDAILRNLQTLAESTQHIPEEIKAQYSEVPWQKISGFRNILVHNYLGDIDPLTINQVIQQHLPPLQLAIDSMIKNNP
jgi:hypothetical protein